MNKKHSSLIINAVVRVVQCHLDVQQETLTYDHDYFFFLMTRLSLLGVQPTAMSHLGNTAAWQFRTKKVLFCRQ